MEQEKGARTMFLNCGCGDYNDKRGSDTNITIEDVEKAAQGGHVSRGQCQGDDSGAE